MRRRLRVLFLFLVIALSAVSVRLFYWQVIVADKLQGMAQSQRINAQTIRAKRGTILSSDLSPLVINQHAYTVYAEPYQVKNKSAVITALSKELGIEESTMSAHFTDDKARWKLIARKVDESVAETLRSYKLDGIGLLEESKRFYPEGSMAAHLVGFVGNNAKGEDQGYFGLEGFYDEQLRGRDGEREAEKDALGHPILLGDLQEVPAEDGRNLVLTIDKTMQYTVENALKKGIEKFQAKGGTVTVMDPYTGAILAMAAYPSYDPGHFTDFPPEYYRNPIVASSYEPGSTFKVLVVATALEQGSLPASATYLEEGPVKIGGYYIRTWNNEYNGVMTLADILRHSSNVGMVFIQRKMGDAALFSMIENLGFGKNTDVDLQDETPFSLRPKDQWYEIDYATASFGQGIAVTPLQMTRAVSAIANGGKLMKPYVVKEIRTHDGKTIKTAPVVERTIFSPPSTTAVRDMMVYAVDEGEAKFSKPKGFRVAGKTGTAQIPIEGHYDSTRTIASFVGFAPANSPRFVMLVTVNEPTTSPWGSETAAPLFFTIAKDLYAYLGVSSTE